MTTALCYDIMEMVGENITAQRNHKQALSKCLTQLIDYDTESLNPACYDHKIYPEGITGHMRGLHTNNYDNEEDLIKAIRWLCRVYPKERIDAHVSGMTPEEFNRIVSIAIY